MSIKVLHTWRPASILTVLVLSGCQSLPNSGPDNKDIVNRASLYYQASDTPMARLNYILIDLSKAVVDRLPTVAAKSMSAGFGAPRKSPPALSLGVGDIVQLSLFESSAGGLFIPADAGSRPGNYITLPAQTIEADGLLKVPYAGNVQAAGRQVAAVQADIEKRLADRAIEPQAVITIVDSRSNQVSVLGDVNGGTRLALAPGGERVLDAISRAGGLRTPGAETNITLQRKGKTATVLFDELVESPQENVYLFPGDVIYASHQKRTFLAFGASGANGRIEFEESDLTLAEGVAKAGGLLDDRANPGQVFVYRLLSKDLMARLGLSMPSGSSALEYPVIFRINMRDPAMYFLAQKFPMADKDVLYVSNADSVEVTKFLQLINTVSAGTVGPVSDVASGRDAIRTIGR